MINLDDKALGFAIVFLSILGIITTFVIDPDVRWTIIFTFGLVAGTFIAFW